MILSVTLGWVGELSAGVSKPLLFCGIAACLFVLLQLALLSAYAVTHWHQRQNLARARVDQRARDVDLVRTRHHTVRSNKPGWNGWRDLYVDRKIKECEGCHSFYFIPCDGKPLPDFQPGQYLTFSCPVPDADVPVIRCYSLSDAPGKDYYRCCIKKIPAPSERIPAGCASSHFNDHIQVGDVVSAKAPRGAFFLDCGSDVGKGSDMCKGSDTAKTSPVVLLAGGVGITPLLSMFNTIVEEGPMVEERPKVEKGRARETHLFLGVRNSRDHLFRDHLAPYRRGNRNARVYICYSRPLPADKLGRDYDFAGRVTVELLNQVLPSRNYDYYMCGPQGFMDALASGLERHAVPKRRIYREAFGIPKKLVRPHRRGAEDTAPTPDGPEIKFSRSGRTIHWDPSCDTLLDFAEAHEVPIESGCRAGNCGTCATAIKSGSVQYLNQPDEEPEKGMCLPCVCIPDGPVELDA